jgi:hypothetical protein
VSAQGAGAPATLRGSERRTAAASAFACKDRAGTAENTLGVDEAQEYAATLAALPHVARKAAAAMVRVR